MQTSVGSSLGKPLPKEGASEGSLRGGAPTNPVDFWGIKLGVGPPTLELHHNLKRSQRVAAGAALCPPTNRARRQAAVWLARPVQSGRILRGSEAGAAATACTLMPNSLLLLCGRPSKSRTKAALGASKAAVRS